MSRCFPYPPPGYSLNTSNDEALIESIKLQKEREKPKAERKKEKKEKKEKKREKEKRDKMAKKDPSGSGFDEAAHQSKGKCIFKCSGEDTELLERSNLTEEHGNAVCSQNSSCSSDSTQNSNKRKRPSSPARNGIQAHGSIIRIRLSKKNDPPGGSSNSNVNCLSVPPQQGSASNSNVKCFSVPPQQRSDSNSDVKCFSVPPQQKTKVTVKASTYKSSVPPCVSVPESKPSTSGRVDKAAAASCSKVHENSIEFQYKNLIENWIPPKLQSEHHDSDDHEWLFQRKPKPTRVEEKVGVASSDSSCGSLAALWLRAQYLHDAEIYALPYTVPY